MKTIGRFLLGWLFLVFVSIFSSQVAFLIYAMVNPQTMGFMGDETPYGFETMGLAMLIVIYIFVDFFATTAWERFDYKAKAKVGISAFLLQFALSLGLLLFFYYPRESLWSFLQ